MHSAWQLNEFYESKMIPKAAAAATAKEAALAAALAAEAATLWVVVIINCIDIKIKNYQREWIWWNGKKKSN